MASVCCRVVMLQWPCLGAVFCPLFFLLLFWNLPGFFSSISIAYRRVIRVYQYEVGDDLSGRFFFLFIFLPHFGFQMHSLIPRLAFLPTNCHSLEMLGGVFPAGRPSRGWLPASCSGLWMCTESGFNPAGGKHPHVQGVSVATEQSSTCSPLLKSM